MEVSSPDPLILPESSFSTGKDPNPHRIFPLSPLIRGTLMGLYIALTIPLPTLYHWQATQLSTVESIPSWLWFLGLSIGGLMVWASLSEQVRVGAWGIEVSYPHWVPRWFWRGWHLPWTEVESLNPRSTGQGGLVYYFVNKEGKGFLLPMRVAGFAELVRRVETETGIDTCDVRPLAQPWMYGILLLLTLCLLGLDTWAIAKAWL